MTKSEITAMMEDLTEERAVVTFTDGTVLHGYIDNYESEYDNDGEASICFLGDGGETPIIYANEIKNIEAE